MVRADFITSLVLMCLGLGTLALSWRMPRFGGSGASVYSAPGLVPGMIGVAIALLGAILCVRAVLALRARAPREQEAPEQGWLRAFSALALCGFYALALVGRAPFWLATFLFVFAFIVGFELWDPEMRQRARHRLAAALIIAAAASAAVSYLFQEIFLVRLP